MGSIFEVTFSVFILFSICYLTTASDDMKDEGLDRGVLSDRAGLWFGPRLGKRSLRLTDEGKSDSLLRLLEAAEVLRSYNDETPMQVNSPNKDAEKVIITPKYARAANRSAARKYWHYEFTPRLGRRLLDPLPATPLQGDNADSVIINPVVTNPGNNYFAPRLDRNYDFTPRLGREVYDFYPGTQIRVARSINGTKSN